MIDDKFQSAVIFLKGRGGDATGTFLEKKTGLWISVKYINDGQDSHLYIFTSFERTSNIEGKGCGKVVSIVAFVQKVLGLTPGSGKTELINLIWPRRF